MRKTPFQMVLVLGGERCPSVESGPQDSGLKRRDNLHREITYSPHGNSVNSFDFTSRTHTIYIVFDFGCIERWIRRNAIHFTSRTGSRAEKDCLTREWLVHWPVASPGRVTWKSCISVSCACLFQWVSIDCHHVSHCIIFLASHIVPAILTTVLRAFVCFK